MFYLIRESGNKPTDITRYTFCHTEEQFMQVADESPMSHVDGYEFSTKNELVEWLNQEFSLDK